jgi:hypothetical protein
METSAFDKNKVYFQLAWGIVLVLAGIGVFFRIPQVMPRVKTIAYFASLGWFIYFCFYLIGLLLILGGSRKIHANYRKLKQQHSNKAQGERS